MNNTETSQTPTIKMLKRKANPPVATCANPIKPKVPVLSSPTLSHAGPITATNETMLRTTAATIV